jgi:hypothetical protein
MYYTNCYWTNHNMDTCHNKKEETIEVLAKVNVQTNKLPRPLKYVIWLEYNWVRSHNTYCGTNKTSKGTRNIDAYQ